MKNKPDQTYIDKEFQNFIDHVYPGPALPPDQIKHIEQAFIAGMLSVFVIRKKMVESTGISFVDGHCDTIYKQTIDYGNSIVAKSAAKRN